MRRNRAVRRSSFGLTPHPFLPRPAGSSRNGPYPPRSASLRFPPVSHSVRSLPPPDPCPRFAPLTLPSFARSLGGPREGTGPASHSSRPPALSSRRWSFTPSRFTRRRRPEGNVKRSLRSLPPTACMESRKERGSTRSIGKSGAVYRGRARSCRLSPHPRSSDNRSATVRFPSRSLPTSVTLPSWPLPSAVPSGTGSRPLHAVHRLVLRLLPRLRLAASGVSRPLRGVW